MILLWVISFTGESRALWQTAAGEVIPLFRVHVVGPSHENVRNASVHATSGPRSQTVHTDADGVATLANFPSGSYRIRIDAFGFKTWTQNQDLPVKQDRPLLVTLQPGVLGCEPHYLIEYDNQPGSPVRGMVIDAASRKGIRGVKIQLLLPGKKKPVLTLHSEKRGLFVVPQIAPGRYRLRVTDGAEYQDEQIDIPVTSDTLFITVTLSRKSYIDICE